MNPFEIGLKIYSSDWLLKYDLSPVDASRLLKSWGVDFVLAQNHYLPMPNSAVQSTAPAEAGYTAEDDIRFREALGKEGIAYWAVACTFFDPSSVEKDPSLRPIDNHGIPMERTDWYLGIPPSHEHYVARQSALIQNAIKALEPDGILLSFTRWPGFWELWMPERKRSDFPEYSYDAHTLARFERETGVPLPNKEHVSTWIDSNVRELWTRWKCNVLASSIQQIKEEAGRIQPNIRFALNTIPFRTVDFDNAREQNFGQDVNQLRFTIDLFEVMTYHQILKRPVEWIAAAGAEVKKTSRQKTVCTIQASALYLNGMHAKENRSPSISDEAFSEAVDSIENNALDGVVIFTWSDLLHDFFRKKKTTKIDALLAAKQHRKAKQSMESSPTVSQREKFQTTNS